MIKTTDYDYNLPLELIAQTPLAKRSESRLMVLNRKHQSITHTKFSNIVDYLTDNDVLVLNDTKVIPARLIGQKEDTGAVIEVLLLKDTGNNIWQTLAKPQRRVKIGSIVSFGNGKLKARCIKKEEMGICEFELLYEGILVEILDELGQMPLPPYIHEKLSDPNRYQTVYAKHPGSAAAPTAGLHFTEELLEQIRAKGVEIIYITLHVGLGTFRPVKEETIEAHPMHSEFCTVPPETAELINRTKAAGGRVICVGTTSCRTLESWAGEDGHMEARSGWTNIYLYPGSRFKVMDGLVTNFHLPESTLIMLVSAFAGREAVLAAYREAVKERYRFFSFGDAMFIGSRIDEPESKKPEALE